MCLKRFINMFQNKNWSIEVVAILPKTCLEYFGQNISGIFSYKITNVSE